MNLQNLNVQEINNDELISIDGGWLFGWNVGHYWRGVTIGAAAGAAGAAAYYSAA